MKTKNGLEFAAWLALVVAVGLLVSARFANAQHHEVQAGGNLILSDGSGYDFPFGGGFVSGQVHAFGMDLGGNFGLTNFPKIGTPGGYRTVKGVYANYWFGEHFFVGADYSQIYGDATRWTKEGDFAGVNVGYRHIGPQRLTKERVWDGSGWIMPVKPGRHEDRFTFSYDKEVKTDAIQPNKVSAWSVGWTHDFPIGGHQAIRAGIGFSYSRFDQFVFYGPADENGQRWRLPTGEIQRLTGTSMSFSISYVLGS